MTKRYSMALRQQMVARLMCVNAPSAAQLARETGITQQNLSRWLTEARNLPFVAPHERIVSTRSVEQKARIIAQAAQLESECLIAYLRQERVKPGHFRRWRLALEEAGEESVGITKRIRKLERELLRKERALAEVAALLVLREPVDRIIEREGEEEEELDC